MTASNGERLSEDWQPTPALWAWARTQRPEFTEAELAEIVEDFKDYWLSEPSSKARKLDWNRTFKRWIRMTWKPKRFSGPDNTPRGLVF